MGPIQVVSVVNGLGTGGAERSLSQLLPLLRARGVEVRVVTLFDRVAGVERHVLAAGFEVTRLRSDHLAGRTRELRGLLARWQPDLIHTTLFEADLLGRLAAVGTGIPVLTSLVNTSYDRARLDDPNVRPFKLEVVRRIDGFGARHLTSGFHAISSTVAEASVAALGIDPHDVVVVGRGRPEPTPIGEEQKRAIRERLDTPPGARVVLHVGRQEFQKGQDILVGAIAAMGRERGETIVWLAGRRGNASDEIDRRIASLDLQDSVRQLGHRDDVGSLMQAADVFVFPSRFEGFGGALIEAMSVGLPAVVSDIPVLREVGGDAVAYADVGAGRPDHLAETLGALLDDPARRHSLGERGARRFAEHYRIDVVADRMAELFRWAADRTAVSS